MKIISIASMRALEAKAVASGTPEYRLMRRAGTRAAAVLEEYAANRFRRVVFFCGGGNNGGDAIVAAGSLNRLPHVFLPFKELSQLQGAAKEAFQEYGARLNIEDPALFDFAPGDLIVDALLGIGFTGDTLREPAASALTMIRNSRCPVVAFDLPSGMNGDTGDTAPGTVKADLTLTFGLPKQGMFTANGKNYCGKISVIPIGVEKMTVQCERAYEYFTAAEARQLWEVPALDAHKNSRGRVLLLCGSMQYPGAACLAAKGALHFSGLVRLLTVNAPHMPQLPAALISRQIHADVTGALPPETLDANADFLSASDVLCAGCGWGSSVSPVLLKKVLDFPGPIVLDADALNVLSRNRKIWNYRSDAVLTPHPGEAARLAAAFGIAPELEREELAAELARRLGAAVVLKGFHTCVATPDGKVTINSSGGPELAMAGSGDVLAGMTAALIARIKDIPAVVRLSVYLHGAAGDAGHGAVIADDLPRLAAERFSSQIWW